MTTEFAEMDSVIAASLLAWETPEDIQSALGKLLPEAALKMASHLASAAPRKDETPGSFEHWHGIAGTVDQLMIERFSVHSPKNTVAATLDYVVKTHPVTSVTYIYVADETGRLLGV